MIRKLAIPAAIIAACFLVTGVAQAATQHSAAWSVSPTKVGTKAAPKPVSIKQSFDVTTDDGTRPEITSDYSLAFQGIHQNTKYFAHCSKQKILNSGQASCRSARSAAASSTTSPDSAVTRPRRSRAALGSPSTTGRPTTSSSWSTAARTLRSTAPAAPRPAR
jgi:hypothetical protein